MPFGTKTLPAGDILLWGSVALLIVALTMKFIRDRQQRKLAPQGPDLRWWKNPPPNWEPQRRES
ncbi:MAG TPA: hypothetical protein VEU51_12260 [Candidatus Acidoferrales bacterium]|nr:hypothetical protein [Candidatus Acidoferrales bacterium]